MEHDPIDALDFSKMLTRSDEITVNDFNEHTAQDFRDKLREKAKSDPKMPIVIYIDSHGGDVDALAKMIETMDEIPNPTITVAMGKAFSAGAILLSHGDIRFIGRNSRVMIHEISSGTIGNVNDMNSNVQEVKRLNRHFIGLLAKNCGIKGGYDALCRIIKDRDGRDSYMNAEQAIEFGIVDAIGLPLISKMIVYKVDMAPEKAKLTRVERSSAKMKKSDSRKPHKRGK